jgi:cytochrome c oxidase assembly protein Cox11
MEPYAGTTCFIFNSPLPVIHFNSFCSGIDNCHNKQQSSCQVLEKKKIRHKFKLTNQNQIENLFESSCKEVLIKVGHGKKTTLEAACYTVSDPVLACTTAVSKIG